MKSTIQKLSVEETAARERLKALIQSLPDGPDGVTKLGPRFVSVPFSVLSQHKNWSARYWVTAECKDVLLEMVDNSPTLATLSSNIETVIETGRVKMSGRQCPEMIPVNVVAALKQAWEG